jgi:hypothetical protein
MKPQRTQGQRREFYEASFAFHLPLETDRTTENDYEVGQKRDTKRLAATSDKV